MLCLSLLERALLPVHCRWFSSALLTSAVGYSGAVSGQAVALCCALCRAAGDGCHAQQRHLICHEAQDARQHLPHLRVRRAFCEMPRRHASFTCIGRVSGF